MAEWFESDSTLFNLRQYRAIKKSKEFAHIRLIYDDGEDTIRFERTVERDDAFEFIKKNLPLC